MFDPQVRVIAIHSAISLANIIIEAATCQTFFQNGFARFVVFYPSTWLVAFWKNLCVEC